MITKLPIVERGDPEYEHLRAARVWNARKPNRYPAAILSATCVDDVVHAVAWARERHLKIAVRSGGHSMCGAGVRDGGLLIDLGSLHSVCVDVDAGTAYAEPAIPSRELAHALARHGLAFPVGHCGTVPLGGYLLAGGMGWGMRLWGPACDNLEQVEIVTADGSRVVASEREHADLFWAARGAGPGFPGIVTRFTLRTHPLPPVIRTSMYLYPLADVEQVSAWASELAPQLPDTVELLVMLGSSPPGAAAGPAGKVVGVIASVFADDDEQAAAALAPLDTCPAIGRALVAAPNQPSSFDLLHDTLAQRLPDGLRYLEDTVCSNGDFATLLPRLAEHLVRAPSPRSLFMTTMHPFGRHHPSKDGAFSLPADTFALCYAIWDNPEDDARNETWLRAAVDTLDDLDAGHYIAETDLPRGPSRAIGSFSPAAWQRLQAIRRQHDPDGLFQPILGLDQQEDTS